MEYRYPVVNSPIRVGDKLMRIRATFWFVLAEIVIAFICALTTDQDIFYRVGYLGVFLISSSFLWSVFSVRGVTVHRYSRGLRQQAGQIFEERFDISNAFPFPRPWVEIRDESDLPGCGGSRVLSWLGAREQRNYSAYTLLTSRGEFHLGPTFIKSGDLFGIFTVEKKYLPDNNLLVLPYSVQLDEFVHPPGILPGGKARQLRTPEVTPHAAGVREYTQGDPLNRIHWASTAHRDRMMVKEFDQDPQSDVWLFIDSQKSTRYQLPSEKMHFERVDQIWLWRHKATIDLPADTFEYAISASASIGDYFIRRNFAVGLCSAGQKMILVSPERGYRQKGKLLETLSFLLPEGKLPIDVLIRSQMSTVSKGSTVVIISSSVENNIMTAVEILTSRHMRPILVLVDPQTFGCDVSNAFIANMLKARNIPVTRLVKGEGIKPGLEKGFYGTDRVDSEPIRLRPFYR